ncbi:unnamed protein product [Tenebrio molitor]|nr:unnamed protein product [Tenebrio molitor]
MSVSCGIFVQFFKCKILLSGKFVSFIASCTLCPIVRARGCSAGFIGTGFLSAAPPKFPAGPIRSRPWRLGPQPGAYKYGAHFVNLRTRDLPSAERRAGRPAARHNTPTY